LTLSPNVIRAPIVWRLATVRATVDENTHARTLLLDLPDWPGHTAGQHVDVRLTAEDGYQTERSYSIASAPESPELALTVERIDDGEVSPYLTEELRTGDELELRGPVGGHFTWRVEDGGPLLLIAGGSGLVPLMAMLRHHAAQRSTVDARLLVSARSQEDILYRDELDELAKNDQTAVHYTLTRETPPGWRGFTGRVGPQTINAVGPSAAAEPLVFVCGPTAFVEHVADLLVDLGYDPATIRAERFGPTGA
jgi:ferredoxin-NADP reductase